MTIESRRKELQAFPRRWGDRIPCVPHTGSPSKALDHVRENFNTEQVPISDPDDNDSRPPVTVAGPLDPTYIQIPIPPTTTMISTKGWTLDSLINHSINFHHVRRVSALSSSLSQIINDYEKSGLPLVIEDCHMHPNWSKEFTLDSFAAATPDDITVRNVHDWQDTVMPLSDFIAKSRSIAPFAEEGEQERFYGKDAQCPGRWDDWLQKANVVPQALLSGGPQDFFRHRPTSSPVETLMCYLGVGDTFTPCHKDLCASSGQNLMCHTENGGSSFWFMTESASAPEAAKFFHALGRELDHEDYVITVEELSKARFKVYIIEQKLGDLVLVPPRSAHQVVNYGGITVKTSWSRMTLKGLVEAYHHELPVYRRVCRPETYRVKSTIRYVLLGLISELRKSSDDDEGRQKSLASNIQEMLVVYDLILAEEFETHRDEMPHRSALSEANSIDDEHILCDFCGCDIFHSFFECRTCVEVDSVEGGYAVCPGCYAEGRSCKCQIMQPMQRRHFKLLLDPRTEAIQVLDKYERRHGRTFHLGNDYCDLNNHSYPRTFRAACILLDIYKKIKSVKVCTLRNANKSHNVPFPWALTCKLCHYARCFSHILSEHRTHSVEALLLHNTDDTHQKYHYNHTAGRKARLEISATDRRSSPLGHQKLVYYAIHFTHCKPIKPQFMKLGWYDTNAHLSYISDEQELPSLAEMESTLFPDTTVPVPPEPDPISTETGPIVDQPPTTIMPNVTVKVKSTRKRKAYVLVPPAPYRLPHQVSDRNLAIPLTSALLSTPPGPQQIVSRPEQTVPPLQEKQVNDSERRSQAIPSTSALLPTPPGPQQMVSRPEQRVPPLQEKRKVPDALAVVRPFTLTLSEIGISTPTTVRKPGSYIIHTREVVPREVEQSPHIVRPVEPVKFPTASKTPHVANPVTAQVITKQLQGTAKGAKAMAKLKFRKSKLSKVNPPPSSSNDTAVVASTSTQEESLKANLSQSQPAPPPMPSSGNVLSVNLAASFAEAVMHQVGFLLQQKTGNPGQPVNSFDTSSSSSGGPQTSYSHSQYYKGHPQQHNNQPEQHNGQTLQYNGSPQQYGPPHCYNPHEYNNDVHHSHVHPQRYSNIQFHASYPMTKQPQFHQGTRKPPPNQAPVQSAGKMGYANHQPQDEYSGHHNGRNKMPAQLKSPYKSSYKRRKLNGLQDSQTRTQSQSQSQSQTHTHTQARFPNNRFNHGPRPPQGPRSNKPYGRPPNYSSSERVQYHDGTSGDHERLAWGRSSEGTPSTSSQRQSSHGRGGYHRRYSSNQDINFRSHGGFDPFVEPKREGSTQRRTENDDAPMDVTDVGSNHTTRLETPLHMANPMFPIPQSELDRDDAMLDNDDALYGAGTPMDDFPVPIEVGSQRDDQDWEDGYEIPEERAIQASAPESAPQLPPTAKGALDSMFNDTDDSMADVTANPWKL